MVFAHDTEVALAAAAALVNTAPGDDDPEELATIADLDAFVTSWGWSGRHCRSAEELAAVRALRPRLRRIWEVDEDGVVEIVNGLLREFRALPQLVKHDGWDYHLHATDQDAPLPDRMAVEAAMAMVDVVRVGELARLRICQAPDCRDVVVDLSKNRSRRFCESGCGNRMAAAAYRARRGTPADEQR
ncbi:CGNR zinc finger domain-containing protein [Nakamurella sp.]|uniref:CGNR zinc finger domain-containing protein n=1 Tax=Nakamurella sp. TaxID=1869182 RepID=UPI003B3A36DE